MDKIMEMHDMVTVIELVTHYGNAEINIGVFRDGKMVHEKWELVIRECVIESIVRDETRFSLMHSPDPGLTFANNDGDSICIYPDSEYAEYEAGSFNEKLYHFLYYREHYTNSTRFRGDITTFDGNVGTFVWP